uniref:60S ribosomal protein L35a n=1 Tax=Chromera velia CCMP2878 TaxID=1169474 RepID=A0A0G4HKQ1_9ALVE|eukprot:Cvel_7255.t1-p1 / transcript=Cvel_7255.t1 / gene=Cvel_7255 / organism=Chromera_velia_CCMP2878 / gene_product=60S ribosomal protein L35a-2, putative / transcript_product=60S ribosomal protein L35a-2, putative / location=Cvel_scaffold374:81933-83181(-) / protein_length=117 / sequence_SO=supercontig / SO=protein_coding / is_pseudo=false
MVKKLSEKRAGNAFRTYQKATFLGYKRSNTNQYENQALLKVQGLETRPDAQFYVGKRCCYVYKAKTVDEKGTKFRTIWGKVAAPHGTSGVVKAHFKKNLPSSAMGARVRVMLYPSRI